MRIAAEVFSVIYVCERDREKEWVGESVAEN